jgi:ketosteroid isomerase-like protein
VSQENVEIVSAALKAWNRRDAQAALACADPDIEVREDSTLPDPEVFHGPEGIIQSVAKGEQVLGEITWEPEEFFDLGERVLIVIRLLGSGTHSGAPVDERIAQIWTLRNSKVICLETFFLLSRALEAAGLPLSEYGSLLEPRS